MSIDNYALERLDDTLDEIESVADSIEIELDDRVQEVTLGDELREMVSKARGYLQDIENSADDDDDFDDIDLSDPGSADISGFKIQVIDAIPMGASLKFREDVEEMLEKFKVVY